MNPVKPVDLNEQEARLLDMLVSDHIKHSGTLPHDFVLGTRRITLGLYEPIPVPPKPTKPKPFVTRHVFEVTYTISTKTNPDDPIQPTITTHEDFAKWRLSQDYSTMRSIAKVDSVKCLTSTNCSPQ